MLRVLAVPGCTAAPASTIKSVTWRPCSGSSRICSLLTTELMPALRTSTSGAAAPAGSACSSGVTDGPEPRAADVAERRGRLDGDRLLERSDAEHRVDRRRPAHLQHDAGLHVGLESLQRDLEPVRADGQIRQQVAAGLAGHGRADE